MFSSFSKTILTMETWLKAFLEDINKVILQQGSQTRGLRAACGRDDILCGPRRTLDFHINNNYYLLSLSGPHAFISIHSQWYYFLVLTLQLFFFCFCLPYLSSIHEEANCIAILWTGSPHSLGSCLFRGLWATCLPHKGGASR